MSEIQNQITRLNQAKSDIQAAIQQKGVYVPYNESLSNYWQYVQQIQSQPNLQTKFVTITENGDQQIYPDYGYDGLDAVAITTAVPTGSSADYGALIDGSISAITASDFGNATSIRDYAFYNCTSLASVTIPNSVTTIGTYAFQNCSSLASVTIPSSVRSISAGLFQNCSSLASVTIPSSVRSIGAYAFSKCSSLAASIEIPSGVTTIGNYAFRGCTGLTAIYCYRETPPSGNTAMFDSTNDCPIYVPADSVDTYKAASGWSNYASRIQAIPE